MSWQKDYLAKTTKPILRVTGEGLKISLPIAATFLMTGHPQFHIVLSSLTQNDIKSFSILSTMVNIDKFLTSLQVRKPEFTNSGSMAKAQVVELQPFQK